jgi:hypothetical protein
LKASGSLRTHGLTVRKQINLQALLERLVGRHVSSHLLALGRLQLHRGKELASIRVAGRLELLKGVGERVDPFVVRLGRLEGWQVGLSALYLAK